MFSSFEPFEMAASHRIIRYRKICKRTILSAEAIRVIRVQAAAPQQVKVRGRSSLAFTRGGKNHPGRGGSRHGSRKPGGGSQGGRGNGGSGRGRGNGGYGGGGLLCGEASSGSGAVAPRPQSPGGVRAGCARATSLTFVTAPNRSARGVARGATT